MVTFPLSYPLLLVGQRHCEGMTFRGLPKPNEIFEVGTIPGFEPMILFPQGLCLSLFHHLPSVCNQDRACCHCHVHDPGVTRTCDLPIGGTTPHGIDRSHTTAMFPSRLQWTIRRKVRKRNMYTSTSKKMHVAYVATFLLHCSITFVR